MNFANIEKFMAREDVSAEIKRKLFKNPKRMYPLALQ
jgi:hypothetical protein